MQTADQLYDEATALKEKGERDAAIATLVKALEVDPNHTISHGMLARLYSDIAEAEKAIFHAKKVVELEPDDTFSYTALSVIYQRCGRIPEAEHAKAIAYQKQMGFE